jgi:P4 family phage/plasmid primase-like protien
MPGYLHGYLPTLLVLHYRQSNEHLEGSNQVTPLLSNTTIVSQAATATEYEMMRALMEQLPATEVVGKRWFSYNSATGCWEDSDKDSYRHLALAIMAPGKRQVTKAHRILDHLEDMIRKKLHFHGFIKAESFNTILINCKNKVLRVTSTTIEVLEHDMEYRFTRSLEVDYEPESVNQLFLDVLLEIWDEAEDRELYQLLWANVLIPDARYEVSPVLYGEAGSGKDTIMGAPMALFGSPDKGLITNFSIAQICDPRSYALPQLQFAAVNVCTELNSKEVEDSSIFKTLVSGGAVPARQIYDKPFNMTTPCKIFSQSNNMPEFRAGTDAERRRLRFLRCMFRPRVVDVSVKERLKVSHPGTLNWMLAGLQKLLAMGTTTMPYGGKASQEVHARFFANNDPLNGFITAYCTFDPTAECAKEDVRQAFCLYAEDNDISKGFRDSFFRSLYKRFTSLTTKRGGCDGARIQLIVGLKLNEAGQQYIKSNKVEPTY